jgi:dihydrodipicolinate synthase/N-acetylneuraminate lyase
MTTRDAIGLARHAETSGAAAVMAVPPCYEPLTGDVATAKTRWQGIFPIMGFLVSGGYVAGVRGALDILGFPVGAARAPIGEPQPARRAELETLLKALTD